MNFLNFPVILILYFACIHINCVMSWTQYFYLKPNHHGTSFPNTKKRYDWIWLKSIPIWVNLRFENKNLLIFIQKKKRKSYIVRCSIVHHSFGGSIIPFLWLVNIWKSQIFLSKSWKINTNFARGRGVVLLVLGNLVDFENFVKFEMYLMGNISVWESICIHILWRSSS